MLDVEAGVSVNSLWTASLFSKREPWKLSAERVVCREDLASGPEGSNSHPGEDSRVGGHPKGLLRVRVVSGERTLVFT